MSEVFIVMPKNHYGFERKKYTSLDSLLGAVVLECKVVGSSNGRLVRETIGFWCV